MTDVLLQRGDRNVFHKLAGNPGASFSENGFARLVQHAEGDAQLAERVGLRLDVPVRFFRELLLRATEIVRSRLFALAGPESREKIQRTLAAIAEDTEHEAGFGNEHEYAAAQARMLTLKNKGELNEAVFFKLAKKDRYTDIIAALSVICGAPMQLVENLWQNEHREAWLIPCKVAGLTWPTVRTILTCRSAATTMSEQSLDTARADYSKLSQSSAARVLRFWQVRLTAAKDTAASSQFAPPESWAANASVPSGTD